MAIRPSVPEIITVNSEDLQTVIRDLLPSQNGFGSELQASNVITPIIDLTPTAEGSSLRSDLQTAVAFGSQTPFGITNTTTQLAATPGYYRIFGMSNLISSASADPQTKFRLSDGFSNKDIWKHINIQSSAGNNNSIQYDFIVFLTTGETISGDSNNTGATLAGSVRQIATGDGTLVNPSGYPL